MRIRRFLKRGLLGLAAIGLFSLGGWAQTAAAPPQDGTIRQQRRDIGRDHRDVRRRKAVTRDIHRDRRQLRRSNRLNGASSPRSRYLRRDIRSDRRARNATRRDVHRDRRDRRSDKRDIHRDRRAVRRKVRVARHSVRYR